MCQIDDVTTTAGRKYFGLSGSSRGVGGGDVGFFFRLVRKRCVCVCVCVEFLIFLCFASCRWSCCFFFGLSEKDVCVCVCAWKS